MSPIGLIISQMILHTETSKLMYNWSFLFVVLHKPTLLPSTFKYTPKSQQFPRNFLRLAYNTLLCGLDFMFQAWKCNSGNQI